MGMNFSPVHTGCSTSGTGAAALATATIVCKDNEHLQLVSADGSCIDQNFKLVITFGATERLRKYGLVDSSEGWDYGDDGPISALGEDITVTITPEATGAAVINNVNLVCGRVF
jgi:hypothetical protein